MDVNINSLDSLSRAARTAQTAARTTAGTPSTNQGPDFYALFHDESASAIKTTTDTQATGRSVASQSVNGSVKSTADRVAVAETPAPSAPATPAAAAPSAPTVTGTAPKAAGTDGGSAASSPTPAPAQSNLTGAEAVFGENPWIENPTAVMPNGLTYNLNPQYFATRATAEKVAAMAGGKVVESDVIASGGGFSQNQKNYMVELPNGKQINPGLVAGFYTHGYPQWYVDRMVALEFGSGQLT